MQTRLRGRIGVHAGKQWHERATESDKNLQRGAVLGTVQLVGCHSAGSGCTEAGCYDNKWAEFGDEWFEAPRHARPFIDPDQKTIWHWELDNPRRFVTPIKANGALGFWTPGPSLEHLMSIADIEE